jgi:minimal PKS acyl carrier protein
MREFTLSDLKKIMEETGGPDDLNGEVCETRFEELGYDSLAVLEIAARIGQDFSVYLPDDVVRQLTSPSATVSVVNTLLAQEE